MGKHVPHVPVYMFLLFVFTLFVGWVTTHSNKCVILLSDEKITIVSDRWGTLLELKAGEKRAYARKGFESKLHPNTTLRTRTLYGPKATFFVTARSTDAPATTASWATAQRMVDVLDIGDKVGEGSRLTPVGFVTLSRRIHRVRRVEVSGNKVFSLNNVEFADKVTLVHKGGDSRVFIRQLWNDPINTDLILSGGNPFSVQSQYWDHKNDLYECLKTRYSSKN